MENKLKEATAATIQTLQSCDIRTIMATGDNLLTAIAVGYECNILDKEVAVFWGDVVARNGVEKIVWQSQNDKQASLNE